jgi:hypothetical protein
VGEVDEEGVEDREVEGAAGVEVSEAEVVVVDLIEVVVEEEEVGEVSEEVEVDGIDSSHCIKWEENTNAAHRRSLSPILGIK